MKYIFIGDVHGQVEIVEKALAMQGKKIFVGDFMDSYDRSEKDMGRCLELVCDAIEDGNTESIFGNHELSYLNRKHRCSGYSSKNHFVFREFSVRVEKLFKSHIFLAPNILITHAGLTRQIWEDYKLTLENLDDKLTEWWSDNTSPVHQIGRVRSGPDSIGGTFWCDFLHEFMPIPGLIQICGHTNGKNIRRIENSYCIDSTESPIMEMEIPNGVPIFHHVK